MSITWHNIVGNEKEFKNLVYNTLKAVEPGANWLRRIKGTLMKIITLPPLVILVEDFYTSASKIRRLWDLSQ